MFCSISACNSQNAIIAERAGDNRPRLTAVIQSNCTVFHSIDFHVYCAGSYLALMRTAISPDFEDDPAKDVAAIGIDNRKLAALPLRYGIIE